LFISDSGVNSNVFVSVITLFNKYL
jgi:hypothetical protein